MFSPSESHDRVLTAVFIPTHGSVEELARAAFLTALADPSPRGRRLAALAAAQAGPIAVPTNAALVRPDAGGSFFGIDLDDQMLRTGPIDEIESWLRAAGGYMHVQLRRIAAQLEERAEFVVVVANEDVDLGVIALKR